LNNIVTRYGGEKFSIILPDTDGTDALKLGERLRQSAEAMHINMTAKTSAEPYPSALPACMTKPLLMRTCF